MSPGTEITTLLHVYEHLSSLPVVQFYFMLCRPLDETVLHWTHPYFFLQLHFAEFSSTFFIATCSSVCLPFTD